MEPTINQLVEKINKDLNMCMGKLIVPAMQLGIKEVREAHAELVDVATDFDMLINLLLEKNIIED